MCWRSPCCPQKPRVAVEPLPESACTTPPHGVDECSAQRLKSSGGDDRSSPSFPSPLGGLSGVRHVPPRRGGYLSGLTLYRERCPDPWLRWFAGAAEGPLAAPRPS